MRGLSWITIVMLLLGCTGKAKQDHREGKATPAKLAGELTVTTVHTPAIRSVLVKPERPAAILPVAEKPVAAPVVPPVRRADPCPGGVCGRPATNENTFRAPAAGEVDDAQQDDPPRRRRLIFGRRARAR